VKSLSSPPRGSSIQRFSKKRSIPVQGHKAPRPCPLRDDA
jgi:hypothetical protein